MRSVFFGPNGARAGWRMVIFFAFVLPGIFLIQSGAKLIPSLKAAAKNNLSGGARVPLGDIVLQGSALLAILVAAWFMSKIEHRPFSVYGLPFAGLFGKLFWQGALWGLATEALMLSLICVFHGFSVGTLALGAGGIATYAALWAIAFVLVGLQEEFCYRGYVLFTLSSGMGFWPAAILTSIVFGAVHLLNTGENWMGGLEIVIWALVMCLTVLRTGSIWFAVGFHAAGDFAETFLISVNDSGNAARGQLLHSTMHGPAWLTGGTVGPEASVFSYLSIALFALAFSLVVPQTRAERSSAA
ncbi:MAG TPA: CPBP family intramembrane glutamic endopeptidase [Candidatus Acidoferrales bacterium]